MKELYSNIHILHLAICKVLKMMKEPLEEYLYIGFWLFVIGIPMLHFFGFLYEMGSSFPVIFS